MKIGITGSNGFIATHLARELRASGHEVVGIDRTGSPDWAGDLLTPGAVRDWMVQESPDVVFHLAAQVGRLFGEEDVAHTVRSNAEMTTVVAKWCGTLGIRLAYVSTSEVYGDQAEALVDEVDGPFGLPHNLYGLSKRWGEEAARLFAPEGLTISRLSMPYGPGAPPGRGRRAMDTFLWQAHHGMPLTVHRGAERSWCWVGDTVHGLRLILEQGAPGVYNVGRDDDPRSMLEIAQLACTIAGASPGLINEVDAPQAQTVVKRLATARLRALGWEPQVSLVDGMFAVYEWIRTFDRDGVQVS